MSHAPPRESQPPDTGPRAGLLSGLRPAARVAVAAIGPVATLVGMLLALGVITPFGGDDAIAQGARKTVEAGTSRLALRVVSEGPDGTTNFSATGAFDYRADRGVLRYDFSRNPGLEWAGAVPARFADGLVYIRFPSESGIPQERPWLRVDLVATDKLLRDASAAGVLPEGAPDLGVLADIGFADPSRVLADLRQSGDVEDLGEERLFGVDTRKYRGTLRAPGADGAAGATATAWITGDDLISRLELTDETDGQRVRTTLDFSDFGTRVQAPPPPEAEVTDVSGLISALIAGG